MAGSNPARSRSRIWRGAQGILALALVSGITQIPTASIASPAPADGSQTSTWGDTPPGLSDLDSRLDTGRVLPTVTQKLAARKLHAQVRWNGFGTPASLFAQDGSLGQATSRNAVKAARSWINTHRAVLGLNAAQTATLRLVNNQKFASSRARAVLFEQTFDGLHPALGSKITVGVAHGDIVYVSSSLTKSSTASLPQPVLTSKQAWLKAATNVGRVVTPLDITKFAQDVDGWDRLVVDGFAQQQQVRLRALALADGTVRPVFEANVVDNTGGLAFGYTLTVDAVTGQVLTRLNQVDNENNVYQFQGDMTGTTCGPKHPFELTDDLTQSLTVSASSVVAANDLVINLYGPGDVLLMSYDFGFGETTTYSPGTTIPKGIYKLEICPLPSSINPVFVDAPYVAAVVASDQAVNPGTSVPYPPKWSDFLANPSLNWSTKNTPTNDSVLCWVTRINGGKVEGCDSPLGGLANIASRAPWDVDWRTGLPTFTTVGNNAVTHEAWVNPVAAGGLAQAPYAPNRDYSQTFTDAWNNSKCDPANLVPGGNDIDYVVGSLFAKHNLMHDWSYYLGFTESNYNMQTANSGDNPNLAVQNDPEVGNAQAGALGGWHTAPTGLVGRDNANQLTLQDGIPGITNQYLFQPIAGAFYAPCADGDLDMGVVGHEYTHAISNRMIGGPDDNISGQQGGSMGESWSDLDALEYLFAHHLSTGVKNPWVMGPYATGNKAVGIRDYALNHNPLQYGDIGFDTPGAEVHADGEIWNGVNFSVRQALVRKYNARYPYTDWKLQRECADGSRANGPLDASVCPGNRRWIQLMFDSFLLQQGATTMLDARDAMLAADQMRFHGKDLKVMWHAFAQRGMGKDASTSGPNDTDPMPGYDAPGTKSANVTLKAMSGGKPVEGKFYLSHYEARTTSPADTIGKTKLDNVLKVTPGRYNLLFAAPGYGMTRSQLVVKPGAGNVTKVLRLEENLASENAGAKVVASSSGSLNAASLIDDTEATNWAGVNDSASVDDENPWVIVDLAGGKHTIRTARVSALLRPVLDSNDPDQSSSARFTALRKFALDVCVATSKDDCTSPSSDWKRVYVSSDDAFPGARPRPLAPNLTLRSFNIPNVVATHVRFVALENQCTGFAGYAGEQDNDPSNDTDCKAASDQDLAVRAAELELFG